MPLIIRELVVEALLSDHEQPRKDSAQAQSAPQNGSVSEEMKLHIIDEAVQQVMEILQRQKDR